jgi:putative PEP-CTERM system histidine kinase
LKAGGRVLGVFTLMDRVNAVPFTIEELDLLKCIGEQVAAGLLRFQLSEELLQSRELEAFQTMSTFFINDLKNAGSTLGLMLKNLPVHFDDPAFRRDALRGIGSTVDRINQIIQRLGTFRQKPALRCVKTDLNHLVARAVEAFPTTEGIEVIRDIQTVPAFMADPEQLESVVTNLLLNAVEAMPPAGGRITVKTTFIDDRAVLSVEDTGCGMAAAFVRESLFRPFCSTKKKGLGIGMFQCRMIVEAHRGSIRVESEPGEGTTFRILLPVTMGIA